MSDQHSTSETPTSVYDDPDLEWYDDDGDGDGAADAPPRRERRRLLTPVSGTLAAVVLLAGGFVGGVEVQKGQQDSGSGTGARGGFPAGLAAARTGQGGGSSGAGQTGQAGGASSATVGTVANVKGSTLYVTGSDGTTIKVRTNDNSKVTRNADSSVGAVHPGDSVVIQGSKAASGTVTASSITATAKGVSAFAGLAGGGLPGAGTGGSSSGGSSSTPGVPQGFAPPAG